MEKKLRYIYWLWKTGTTSLQKYLSISKCVNYLGKKISKEKVINNEIKLFDTIL